MNVHQGSGPLSWPSFDSINDPALIDPLKLNQINVEWDEILNNIDMTEAELNYQCRNLPVNKYNQISSVIRNCALELRSALEEMRHQKMSGEALKQMVVKSCAAMKAQFEPMIEEYKKNCEQTRGHEKRQIRQFNQHLESTPLTFMPLTAPTFTPPSAPATFTNLTHTQHNNRIQILANASLPATRNNNQEMPLYTMLIAANHYAFQPAPPTFDASDSPAFQVAPTQKSQKPEIHETVNKVCHYLKNRIRAFVGVGEIAFYRFDSADKIQKCLVGKLPDLQQYLPTNHLNEPILVTNFDFNNLKTIKIIAETFANTVVFPEKLQLHAFEMMSELRGRLILPQDKKTLLEIGFHLGYALQQCSTPVYKGDE